MRRPVYCNYTLMALSSVWQTNCSQCVQNHATLLGSWLHILYNLSDLACKKSSGRSTQQHRIQALACSSTRSSRSVKGCPEKIISRVQSASAVAIHNSRGAAQGLSCVCQVDHDPVLEGLLIVFHAHFFHKLDDSMQDPGHIVHAVQALSSDDIQALDGCTQTTDSCVALFHQSRLP